MTAPIASVLAASAVACLLAACQTKPVADSTPSRPDACPVLASTDQAAATPVSPAVAQALNETLMDERRAQAFYTRVMERHGQVRPFMNIVRAEARHAAVVESLMNRHGVTVPAPASMELPPVPDSLVECNRLAARLERENLAMYDRLLNQVTEPDIRSAFEALRDASKYHHLPAFERWSG